MAPAERLARQWHRHEPRILVAEAGLVVSDDIVDWLAEHPGMMLVNPLGRKLAVVGEAENAERLRHCMMDDADTLPQMKCVDLPTVYVRKLRRRLQPVVVSLNEVSPIVAERQIFTCVYKGITDLVTKYVWPEPAFWLTKFCARWGVSPNMVTITGILLTIWAAWLFYQGNLAAGLAAAWTMCLLDTLDGKLARVTVTSSRFGNILDHGNDILHPPIWWACLAIGINRLDPHPWVEPACWIILGSYVVMFIGEQFFKARIGFNPFMWRPFDGRFRLVIARRNSILLIVTAGLLLGSAASGYQVAALWSVISAIILAIRLAMALQESRQQPVEPWIGRP